MSGESDFIAKFFGWVLMTIGFLIMFVSGLCSTVGFLAAFSGGLGDLGSGLGWVLILGGIPFGVGFLLWLAGSALAPKKTFAPRHSLDDPRPPDPPKRILRPLRMRRRYPERAE